MEALLSVRSTLPSLAGFALLLVPMTAPGLTVATEDGLAVTFSDTDGRIAEITVDGASIPLLPGRPGGLSLLLGSPVSPSAIALMDFNSAGGPWTSALNSDWASAGNYVTWVPDGGVDDSAHLLLGNGAAQGVGMAMTGTLPAPEGGGRLRIAWEARASSTETTQILNVRLFDGQGTDITQSSPAPPGWAWSPTSQAHAVWGMHCETPDTWEHFEETYDVPPEAASIRLSLRHWTGGDHWLHIDNLSVDLAGGIGWSEEIPVLGKPTATGTGFAQSIDLPGHALHVETRVAASAECFAIHVNLEDTSEPLADRPILLRWTLPVAVEGWRWWDDIDTSRPIGPGMLLSNTLSLSGHRTSLYPLSSVTGAGAGLSLGVPMSEPLAQRSEAGGDFGLRSVWELALSPVTAKLGPGRASVSLVVAHHDPSWGFRGASQKYMALFPGDFVKRTTREGSWLYPIAPSQIASPEDFGFAFYETRPLDEAEREVCAQHGIGIFHYAEPWLAWQGWSDVATKPPIQERIARMERWASASGELAHWESSGGIGDSGHLVLGNGESLGAGMATAGTFAVPGGESLRISWEARCASTETNQILCVRVFDAQGTDITSSSTPPTGWIWTSTSEAHAIPGIQCTAANTWQAFERFYTTLPQAVSMRLSLRHWNGGDHIVHIDNLRVEGIGTGDTLLDLAFDADGGPWTTALNADWENPVVARWYQAPRRWAAQAVLNSAPHGEDGLPLLDIGPYLWHRWGTSWSQAWPLDSDPDLPSPSTFELFHDYGILPRIEETQGIYIDSVTTSLEVGGWENHRREQLALTDSPLSFSLGTGDAVQLAPQAQAEFLTAIAKEIRAQGRLMMCNLFPQAMRFHCRNADIMGSEISQLVESDAESRLRRTLAGQRIVSNLLQWGWDTPTFATHEQMEEFIRGQLFWGFYPAVSSAGGLFVDGGPNRYFLHPELYERDRPLFRKYIPVIRALSTAGWEPVTWATCEPPGEIERFGDFHRGPVLLTVRGVQRQSLDSTVTVDLAGCGLSGGFSSLEVMDLLAEQPISAEVNHGAMEVHFPVSLEAGEVGVYRVTPDQASGLVLR
jgi:hypothetical protein